MRALDARPGASNRDRAGSAADAELRSLGWRAHAGIAASARTRKTRRERPGRVMFAHAAINPRIAPLRGAPPPAYAFGMNPPASAIGIDFGGTYVRAALVSPAGDLRHFMKVPSRADEGPEGPIESMASAVQQLRA